MWPHPGELGALGHQVHLRGGYRDGILGSGRRRSPPELPVEPGVEEVQQVARVLPGRANATRINTNEVRRCRLRAGGNSREWRSHFAGKGESGDLPPFACCHYIAAVFRTIGATNM